jgi:hypothetical protein
MHCDPWHDPMRAVVCPPPGPTPVVIAMVLMIGHILLLDFNVLSTTTAGGIASSLFLFAPVCGLPSLSVSKCPSRPFFYLRKSAISCQFNTFPFRVILYIVRKRESP